jgi:hypothetical protein
MPSPEPPRRCTVSRASPAEHRHLARIWRKHPEHPRSEVMTSHHRALARRIQTRLEEGSARIAAERTAYRDALRWMSMQGWL